VHHVGILYDQVLLCLYSIWFMSCVYGDWLLAESTAFMLTGQQPVSINA